MKVGDLLLLKIKEIYEFNGTPTFKVNAPP